MNFKNTQGQYLYQALFYETIGSDKSTVIYTLKAEDYEGYPSLRKLYLASKDITEYSFATQYLGGWDHWKALKSKDWFKPYYDLWRDELLSSLKTEILRAIYLKSLSDDKDALTAARMLLERLEKPVEKKFRGRPIQVPSEEENERTRLLEASRAQADFERLKDLN